MADWQGANPDKLPAAHLSGSMGGRLRKNAMRRELRRRMAVSSGDSARVLREIDAYLRNHPQIRVIALFSPLPGEVDLTSLTKQSDRIWAFPKVEGRELTFHRTADTEGELRPGAFGILEPIPGLPTVDAGEIDLFLCPGLGFDRRGGRIGRGKGFYDGILAKARPDAVKLGVCFTHQIVDEVVMEEHDVHMNGVISG
jgi:5-formyltetrahydrofolate cyclo-ligase